MAFLISKVGISGRIATWTEAPPQPPGNLPPTWTTPAGALLTLRETESPNGGAGIYVVAVDPEAGPVSYEEQSALPSGLTLNSVTGMINGTAGTVGSNTTTSVTIRASDPEGNYSDRSFSFTITNNRVPQWQTVGDLGSFGEGTTVNVTVAATDPDDDPLTYTVQSGSLPTGLSLNGSTGAITGTAPSVASNTEYNFTIRAADDHGDYADRAFTVQITNTNQAPVWTTAAGALFSVREGQSPNGGSGVYVAATDPEGGAIAYSAQTPMPSGLTLNSITGMINGTAGAVSGNTTTSVTIRATEPDGLYTDRNFSITVTNNQVPEWQTTSPLANLSESGNANYTLVATDPDADTVSYALAPGSTLPGTLTLSAAGVITGTGPAVTSDTTYNFTVRASDPVGDYADRAFSLQVINRPYDLDAGQAVATVKYNGNSGTQSFTGLGFQPRVIWIKCLSNADDPGLFDSVAGTGKHLNTAQTYPDQTSTTAVTAFGTDGFTLGANATFNTSGRSYIAYCFPSSAVNVTDYSGIAGDNTVNHGLGRVPQFMIVKNRASSYGFTVYHAAFAATHFHYLNGSSAPVANASAWVNFTPTATQFKVGAGAFLVNQQGVTHTNYLFGNGTAEALGTAAASTTVTVGFRPKVIWLKTNGATAWYAIDTLRGIDKNVKIGLSNTEATEATVVTAVSDTGFTLGAGLSGTIAYMALA